MVKKLDTTTNAAAALHTHSKARDLENTIKC
jgi:hypothetical protein